MSRINSKSEDHLVNCNTGGQAQSGTKLDSPESGFCHGLSGLTALLVNNREFFEETRLASLSVHEILVVAIDAKDHYTFKHSRRVASLSNALAECAGFQSQELEDLQLAALLHDVGKIGIPTELLLKDKINERERGVLEKHATMSSEIIDYFQCASVEIAQVVRHHHERIDGNGYPDQLKGPDIPLASRILAIADSWDAMTANRPYRAACSKQEAARELRAEKNAQFDDMLVDLFLVMMSSSLMVN